MVTVLLVLMFACLILGFPMFLCMIVPSLVVLLYYFPSLDISLLMQQVISGISSYVLLAIPMYIFTADIMCAGETTKRLLDWIESIIGHVHGGLAITGEATCTLFGAISGSTMATLVTVGKPMRPSLLKGGYNDSHTTAMLMSSANIALLIPPSIMMILYCVVTGTSVAELFLAGIGPGIFIFICFAVYDYFYAKRRNLPTRPKATWKERFQTFKKAFLTLGLPLIILGGIYSGMTSPTEAAAIAVLYALILEVLVYKSITWKDIPKISYSTGLVTGIVFIIAATGQAFSWAITFANIPNIITETLLGPDPSALVVMFVCSLIFLVACMFVDSIPVVLIVVPIIFPVAVKAGVNPIQLGIIVTLQSAIGAITPPFGCNIFTACAIWNLKFQTVIKGLAPYILIFVVVALLMILVPELSLWYKFFNLGF